MGKGTHTKPQFLLDHMSTSTGWPSFACAFLICFLRKNAGLFFFFVATFFYPTLLLSMSFDRFGPEIVVVVVVVVVVVLVVEC